jgi:hypothetical protein
VTFANAKRGRIDLTRANSTLPIQGRDTSHMSFPRTRVDRLIMVDHLVSSGDRERHFALKDPVFIEAGAIIGVYGDELVVEHADGTTTRHPGGEEMRCRGWEPLGSDIGRRLEE